MAVAILLLSWTSYFSELNSAAYDFTLRLAGPVSVKSPTTIIAIDEDSLRRIGGWPRSRDKVARLIDRIESAKPRVIALDMLLDDKKAPETDNMLAAAIANSHAIVLAAHMDGSPGTSDGSSRILSFCKITLCSAMSIQIRILITSTAESFR